MGGIASRSAVGLAAALLAALACAVPAAAQEGSVVIEDPSGQDNGFIFAGGSTTSQSMEVGVCVSNAAAPGYYGVNLSFAGPSMPTACPTGEPTLALPSGLLELLGIEPGGDDPPAGPPTQGRPCLSSTGASAQCYDDPNGNGYLLVQGPSETESEIGVCNQSPDAPPESRGYTFLHGPANQDGGAGEPCPAQQSGGGTPPSGGSPTPQQPPAEPGNPPEGEKKEKTNEKGLKGKRAKLRRCIRKAKKIDGKGKRKKAVKRCRKRYKKAKLRSCVRKAKRSDGKAERKKAIKRCHRRFD